VIVDLSAMKSLIRSIPDFPIPGILFRDVTPLIKDKDGYRSAIDMMAEAYTNSRIDYVVAIEARGYIFGAPVAYRLGAGFIPVRKPGKLPFDKINVDYELEYGTNTLEMHADAVTHGKRVLVVDDLLATGGTAAATGQLLHKLGADLVGYAFLVELPELKGRAKLAGSDVRSFITF
jgi:adenine phosphoribosyltransferase